MSHMTITILFNSRQLPNFYKMKTIDRNLTILKSLSHSQSKSNKKVNFDIIDNLKQYSGNQ